MAALDPRLKIAPEAVENFFKRWISPEAPVRSLGAKRFDPWCLRHEWFGNGSAWSPLHGNRRGLPVVASAAFRVAQHIVGFLQFQKWAAFQPRGVGMQFQGTTPECRFNFLAAGIRRKAENQVIILPHGSWDFCQCANLRRSWLKLVERTGHVTRSVKPPIRPGE